MSGDIVLNDRDYQLFRDAAWRFDHGSKADAIQFKCFNEAEATAYQNAMAQLYPHIPVFTTWMVWV